MWQQKRIHLLQPCNRIFIIKIVLTSCLRLFWFTFHSWLFQTMYSFLFYHLSFSKPPCLMARGFIFLSFKEKWMLSFGNVFKGLTFMDSWVKPPKKKKPQLFHFIKKMFPVIFHLAKKSRFMFFMLSRRIYLFIIALSYNRHSVSNEECGVLTIIIFVFIETLLSKEN